MQNTRIVGIAIIVLAVLFFVIGFYYVSSAENALLAGHTVEDSGTCSHDLGAVCPFADLLLFALGVFLFVQKKSAEKLMTHAKVEVKSLEGEEAQVAALLVEAQGMMFQNELVEKTQLSKVKVTRILDKLEGKGLVERRRRGMTNVIILK